MHRLVKAQAPPPKALTQGNGQAALSLAACEAQRAAWSSVWLIGDPAQEELRPWLEDAPEEDDPQEPIDAIAVETAERRFERKTGQGVDAVNPRVYGNASVEARS